MDLVLILQLFYKILYFIVYALFASVYDTIKFFIPAKYRAKSIALEIVLVTGSGSGLGRSMAKKFSKLGAVLVLVDINEKGNLETLKDICDAGGKAYAFKCDLSNKDEIYKVAKEVEI
jgi:all-trans-retinol dehydrogenase (NAD+)